MNEETELGRECRKLEDDGRFYAEDGVVWRAPKATKTPAGTNISLGFPVCTPHEALGDSGAKVLASILNQALDSGIIKDKDQ